MEIAPVYALIAILALSTTSPALPNLLTDLLEAVEIHREVGCESIIIRGNAYSLTGFEIELREIVGTLEEVGRLDESAFVRLKSWLEAESGESVDQKDAEPSPNWRGPTNVFPVKVDGTLWYA